MNDGFVRIGLGAQYVYQNSKLLEPVVYIEEPVLTGLGMLGLSRKNLRLNFWPIPARKESNVPKLKSSWGLTVLLYKYCVYVRTRNEHKKLKIMTEVYISFFFVGFVHFWYRLASNEDLCCNFQRIPAFCRKFRISFFFVSSCIGRLQLHMSCPK